MKLENLSCRRRVSLLLDYLDRTLPPPELRLLAGHRRSCRACAALLASLERTVGTLRALKRRSMAPERARRALRASLNQAGSLR